MLKYFQFLLLALLPCAAGDQKVAMVLAVKGTVTVQSAAGTSRPARPMALLGEGDQLTIAADGEATLLILSDKHRERLKAGAKATLSAKGCTPATAVERLEAINPRSAVRYEGAERLAGGGKGAAVTFRDPKLPKEPPVVTPLFGATVLTDRPTLSWKAVEGAAEYRVRLFGKSLDKLTGTEKPLWKVETKEPKLTYPAKEKPLVFGRVYSWLVSVQKGDEGEKVVWESQFFVITKAEAAELANIKPLTESKDPADLLLAAMSYQEHGVYEEALALYERLAKLLPKEGQYQAALADYYERAGRLEEAKKALAKAKQLGFVVPGSK